MGIFCDNAPIFYENGYNLIPDYYGTKKPALPSRWNKGSDVRQASWEFWGLLEKYENCNVSVLLGKGSNTVALDFDYNIDNLHEEISKLLPDSPVKKKGAKGYTAFYQYNGERTQKWSKDGKQVLELLSSGNKTTLPPSIHPETKEPYIWLTPDTFANTRPSSLPVIPNDFIDSVNKIFDRYRPKIIKDDFSGYLNRFNNKEVSIEDAQKALDYIPADDYTTWVLIGQCLHHTFGSKAFDVWDLWSKKASNYKANEMIKKWNSFGKYHGEPATIGTLFHHAMNNGYIPEVKVDIAYDKKTGICDQEKTIEQVEDQEEEDVSDDSLSDDIEFPKELLNAPGLVGEVSQWLTEASIRPQPILALGAAISAVGAIYGRRIRTKNNIRSNVYTLGIARSGAGKDSARQAIDRLFDRCELSSTIIGDPTSPSGLINTMYENIANVNVALIHMDEMGKKLQSYSSSLSHESKLITTIMEMFSSSSGNYRSREYANKKENASRTLIQPCLCIYGTSTPKTFYDALTSDDSTSGFLNRILIFEAPEEIPAKVKDGLAYEPPQQLVHNIKEALNKYKKNYDGTEKIYGEPSLTTIKLSDAATKALDEFDSECDSMANNIQRSFTSETEGSLWTRASEYAEKLALIAHHYQGSIIDSVTMEWAIELVKYLVNSSILRIRNNVFDTDHHKKLKSIHNSILKFNKKHGEYMPHKVMADNTNKYPALERNQIIAQLQEAGKIIIEEKLNTRGRPVKFYLALE